MCSDKPSSTPHTPQGVRIVPASSQNTPQSVVSGSQPVSQGTPSSANLSASQLSGVEEMGEDFDNDDDADLQRIDDAVLQEMQS